MNINSPVVLGDNGALGAALDLALAEARRRSTSLRVVHCAPLPGDQPELFLSETMYREIMAVGQAVLDTTRRHIEQHDDRDVAVEYVLSSGSPAVVLVEESRTAQLVVTGIDDIPWYDRLLGGAVAGHLARHAHCALITVPDVPASDGSHEGVVVALDGRSAPRPLLALAFELAQHRGCTLHAVQAVSDGAVEEAADSAHAGLAEVLAGWSEMYPDVRIEREVFVGRPSEECIAATRRAELVVMGRSSKRSLHRPTAAVVVQHASCPVAVVPLDSHDA